MKKLAVAAAVVGFVAVMGALLEGLRSTHRSDPIHVGILHSLSGAMAGSEVPVADATRMAIDEINAAGGVLGRRLEAVSVDGASDPATFAREAQALLLETKVAVVFGCWTSASRKMVRPIFEKHGGLLFYPVQYEGLERSPNIVYTGAAPNQQIIPAVKWCLDNIGRRVFVVGSDYVFPRTGAAIIADQLAALGGELVGESYILLDSRNVQPAVDAIVAARPDVVLNLINGRANIDFFRALRSAGIDPRQTPTMSFSIGEPELAGLDTAQMAGDFATWNYFQSISSDENRRFVKRIREVLGDDAVTSDPMEAAYAGVHLWAMAAEDVGVVAPDKVRGAIPRQSFRSPGGIFSIDAENQHAWKTVRIGRVRTDGQFDIVWDSGTPVRPVPYPIFRSQAAWDSFLRSMYEGWGRRWANPGN